MKKFTLTIEIQENNTPQKWEFSKECSGIEQLAIWFILCKLAKQQLKKIIEL
jgi:hypothetical protein